MAAKTIQTNQVGAADTPLDLLIDLFVVSRQIEGKSKKTTDWYRANLNKFAEFATNGHAPTLAELTLDQARVFVAHLQGRTTRYEGHGTRPAESGNLSPYTVHAYVRTLRAFGSWMQEEGYVATSPYQRLKPSKLPENMVEILADDEIKRLLAAINPKCYLGSRMYAMFLLLLDTGIRASELCGLTLGNVHFGVRALPCYSLRPTATCVVQTAATVAAASQKLMSVDGNCSRIPRRGRDKTDARLAWKNAKSGVLFCWPERLAAERIRDMGHSDVRVT